MIPRSFRALSSCLVGLGLAGLAGCSNSSHDPKLAKQEASEAIPNVPVPAEGNPPIASIADMTVVLERPAPGARVLGYLHAGSRVARANEPYSRKDCPGGWYPVRPIGFVCAGEAATIDPRHPTLLAMAIQPSLDQPLPYTFARTRVDTPLYEREPRQDAAVREVGKLRKRAGMAVVGSWTASMPGGAPERFALLTSGKFVRAADLEAAESTSFSGALLDKDVKLPLAWVVKRGVRAWKLDGTFVKKHDLLDYHARLELTGRFRTVDGEKYWAVSDGRWVRHKDVTLALPRSKFPDFAKEGVKWIDLSIITSVLIAYEGKQPILATLASVARPIEGDPGLVSAEVIPAAAVARPADTAAKPSPNALGTFEVRAKHVTLVGANPREQGESYELYDVPWVLELSSGRKLYGAYWHDRFGVEHGGGNVELAPADAQRLFSWVTPALPSGFHGFSPAQIKDGTTYVVLRK
ncbi:MAG TPA: L,D-transpeptidase [Polyangiaceae bacterium]|jgi:hypothetical protein|nr:L,D-transpeptidase [Polyangiaceae bacterium]